MFLSIPDSMMNSHILWKDVLFWRQAFARVLPRWNSCFKRFKTLCWIVRFTIKLWLNCFFCLSSVCGRCFWASQILWWILTCSEQKFCFDCNALQKSFLDVIDVLDDLKCSVELSDFFIKLWLNFFSVYQACAVDVLEHPRFCDEFSHLVNRSFVSTTSLCSSFTLME